MCMSVCLCASEDNFQGPFSIFCGSWGLNLDLQARQQVPKCLYLLTHLVSSWPTFDLCFDWDMSVCKLKLRFESISHSGEDLRTSLQKVLEELLNGILTQGIVISHGKPCQDDTGNRVRGLRCTALWTKVDLGCVSASSLHNRHLTAVQVRSNVSRGCPLKWFFHCLSLTFLERLPYLRSHTIMAYYLWGIMRSILDRSYDSQSHPQTHCVV
jgi:hypothetical protein